MPRLIYIDRIQGLNNPQEGWEVTDHPEKHHPVIYAGVLPGSKIHACIYLGGRHTNSTEERILRGDVEIRDIEGGGKRAVLVHESIPDDESRIYVCVAARLLHDEPLVLDPLHQRWESLRRQEHPFELGIQVCQVGWLQTGEVRHYLGLDDGGLEVRLKIENPNLPDIVCRYRNGELRTELKYFDDG